MNSDFRALLSALNEHRVRYLVVGGYAVMHHAEPRYTKDIDLWIEPTPGNARRAFQALLDFIGPLDSVAEDTLAHPDVLVILGRPPTRIDLLTSIPAVRFSTAWRNRVVVRETGLSFPLLGIRELLRNKRRLRRPQDLADVEVLELARARARHARSVAPTRARRRQTRIARKRVRRV